MSHYLYIQCSEKQHGWCCYLFRFKLCKSTIYYTQIQSFIYFLFLSPARYVWETTAFIMSKIFLCGDCPPQTTIRRQGRVVPELDLQSGGCKFVPSQDHSWQIVVSWNFIHIARGPVNSRSRDVLSHHFQTPFNNYSHF